MKRTVCHISLCVLTIIALVGCDVHEFPEESPDRVPFLLHLDFNTDMPLFKEVLYTRDGELSTNDRFDSHDIRYIINAYRTNNLRGENRTPDTTFVFSRSNVANLDYTAVLELPEGTYDFKVWADYVNAGSENDKYYNTSDFSEIILSDRDNHSGSNDYRDAFRGYATATVSNPACYTGSAVDSINNQTRAEMKRPMGKFKFISTDVDVFLSRVTQMMKDKGMQISTDSEPDSKADDHLLQSIDMGMFYVVFRYNVFMPCSFNMFTDKPADSWTGMSFISQINVADEDGLSLGYDYIFVNGSETSLSISLEVYNREGELMSSTNPINVPIVRSKLTLVKGAFLTSTASGGVTINPGYDGEDYNIEIY